MSGEVVSTAGRPPVVRRYLTVVTALLSMVGPFTIDTYLPSFPDIEADFGVDRAMLSHSLSVYLAAFAVSTLFWGPLADRLGRRRVILASPTYTLASIGCAMAAITIQALDCFPHHRGAAASVQGFLQMLINAGVGDVTVPQPHTQWLHFVLGQAVFLLLALALRFRVGQGVLQPEGHHG